MKLHKNKNIQSLLMAGGLSSNVGERNAPQAQPTVQIAYNGANNSEEVDDRNGTDERKKRFTTPTSLGQMPVAK